jgi:hypothetical protein
MKARARHFVFRQVYDMAAIVEASLAGGDSLMELNCDEPDVRLGIAKPRQISLLHQYIYAVIAIHHRYAYRKNADMYEEDDIAELESLLDAYEIPYGRFEDFDPAIEEASARSRAELPFYQWFLVVDTCRIANRGRESGTPVPPAVGTRRGLFPRPRALRVMPRRFVWFAVSGSNPSPRSHGAACAVGHERPV